MAYTSGMLQHRVEILKRVQAQGTISKQSGKVTYESQGCVWSDVTWKKGAKNLNMGAFDAVDTMMFRMRANCIVTRDSYLQYEGIIYQIQSYHKNYQDNTIQITAIEAPGTVSTIKPYTPSSSQIVGGSETSYEV